MDIKTLHKNLLEAYTVPNLNRLSLILLNIYKNQQYTILQSIAEIISDFVEINIEENGKGFARFMMLYHPDRVDYHRNEINRLASENNLDGLLEYSHILKLERIEEIAKLLDSYEDVDYSPVYEWDTDLDGFRVVNDPVEKDPGEYSTDPQNRFNVYEAIQIRMYGHTNIDFPFYYMEDWEELELSDSNIEDLEGIQFCKHLKKLDLSGNHIFDLSLLSSLVSLEEINLSGNKIGYLDHLATLKNLCNLDVSNNPLDDIETLLELPLLEYINVSGTRIGKDNIDRLKEIGLTVDME